MGHSYSVRDQIIRKYLWHYGKKDDSCVLCGSMPSVTGTPTMWKDYSTKGNNGTITGATWEKLPSGLWVNSFDGTDDYISLGAGANLDFTSEDMSWVWWGYQTSIASDYIIYSKGDLNADGIYIQYVAGGSIRVVTSQAAAYQLTGIPVGSYSLNTFYLNTVTRTGASIRVYRNNVDITNPAGNHIDPITAAARTATISTSGAQLACKVGLFRVYKNKALSLSEITGIYRNERHLFGV